MHLFYFPFTDENDIKITGTEAAHCAQVLRHKEGDTIKVSNGIGTIVTAEIINISKKEISLRTISTDYKTPKKPEITLAMCILKNNDRTEWVIEKACEIGIQNFQLLTSRHAVAKKINIERLEKIIISATKQSEKHHKPILHPLASFTDFIKTYQGKKLMATCADVPKKSLKQFELSQENTVIFIGPEGDFSEDEIKLAMELQTEMVSLGDERLRTETAAIAACALILID